MASITLPKTGKKFTLDQWEAFTPTQQKRLLDAENKTGQKYSEERKQAISRAVKGKPRPPISEEHKAAISRANAKPKSEEHKAAMKKAHKGMTGKSQPESQRQAMRAYWAARRAAKQQGVSK
jgi:hypothetical protein